MILSVPRQPVATERLISPFPCSFRCARQILWPDVDQNVQGQAAGELLYHTDGILHWVPEAAEVFGLRKGDRLQSYARFGEPSQVLSRETS